MNDLLAQLNPQQRDAVTLPPEHTLVLAGAGSGKTRVLTTRLAWLIANGQVGTHGVLAVTFTNKAAREMMTRLSALLPVDLRGMWIGTFHGLSNRLLRMHHKESGLPALFQILDTADQLSLIKRMLKDLNIDEEKFPPRELMYFINAHKEEGLRASQAEAFDSFTTKKIELYSEYETQCNRTGVVDFAELLLRSTELLRRNETLRRHYQERFCHVLVDEFQDTNSLQYSWLKLMAGVEEEKHSASIFAVGDDDQSIYAFRGARVGNMRDFEQRWCRLEDGSAMVVRLEQNYRSVGNILAAANAIIKNNRARLGKNLWTSEGHGEPIRVFEGYSDLDEARFVVDELQELVRGGETESQVALLYRSNAQSRVLEHELFSRKIAYRVHGGLRFFERQEVKHALAYLRLMSNPDDDTAFLRVVNFPTRGIGTRTIEALQQTAHQANSSLYNAAASLLTGKAGGMAGSFVRLIEEMRALHNLPLPEIVEHVIEHSGLRAHYLSEREGTERLGNLDELINAAAVFAQEEEALVQDKLADGQLTAFLSHAALEAGDHQADEGKAAVQLMSVHAAKGLEFNVVFITGLEQGLFPHENAVQNNKGGDAHNGLEEERRLMYVAITRARRRLYLSGAQSRMLHGRTRYAIPSCFLDELPQELLLHLSKKSSPHAGTVNDTRTWGNNKQRQGIKAATGYIRQRQSVRKGTGASGFYTGQNVCHAKFGDGVIVSVEGQGSDARVQVNFGGGNLKWLALEYAQLKKEGAYQD